MKINLTQAIFAKELRNNWIGTYPLVLEYVDYSYIEGRTYPPGRFWRAVLRSMGVRPSTIRRIARNRRNAKR